MRAFRFIPVAVVALACSEAGPAEEPCRTCGDASAEPACAACSDVCEEQVTVPFPAHLPGDLEYDDVPPAGGAHNDCWAEWGVHDEPVRPENWVHNLEHGGVVFLHNCPDGCADDLAALVALAEERPRTLVTEYTAMPQGFAAVAWTHRLVTPCLDLDAFASFYDRHFASAEAPEDIPGDPPAACQ